MTKTCPICSNEFSTEKETQVFCSGACIAKAKLNKALAKRKKKPKVKRVKKENLNPIDTIIQQSVNAPEATTEITVSSPLFKSHGEPWIENIRYYCQENDLHPQDLIDFHSAGGQKPKKEKKQDHTLSYFEQRQNRNMGL